MKLKFGLVLFLLFSISISAQIKNSKDPEIRLVESQLKMERARLETSKARIDSLERELALKTTMFLKDRVNSEQQAAIQRAKIETVSASLASARKELAAEKQRTTELELQIKKLTKERDKARSWKISFLRVFGIKRK